MKQDCVDWVTLPRSSGWSGGLGLVASRVLS